MIDIKVVRLTHTAKLPTKGSLGAAAFDVYAAVEAIVRPGCPTLVRTGLALEIPPFHEIQVRSRSGLALNSCITVFNAPGTIDEDYRGEMLIILFNHSTRIYEVSEGDRIAQLVVSPVLQAQFVLVDHLSATGRGLGGLGSTGQ